MTVKQDMEKRIEFYEADQETDFDHRIIAAGIKSAMGRMSEEELNRELEDEL